MSYILGYLRAQYVEMRIDRRPKDKPNRKFRSYSSSRESFQAQGR
jgi:hypothetical protein